MPVREDLVASAAKFLQDPTVASSPVESRIAFLQAKNLTQEEVSAALARAASESGAAPTPQQPTPPPQAQPQPYYGQYPPAFGWQPPPEAPRRDWRDVFIMATVVSGLGYGLYALTKRYVYPLIAPPTPERLEQDKKAIDEQFEKAFALVDQLAKDTEALKAAELDRTNRLDIALLDLEHTISDLKAANSRRQDESIRIRDDVAGLKDELPKVLEAQKSITDNRLREVNTELKSLKALISQRMNPNLASLSSSSYLRPSGTTAEADSANGSAGADADTESAEPNGKASDLARDPPSNAKASIPDWQRTISTQSQGS